MPKAHLFNEGGGIVTGTHDKKEARRLLVQEWLDWNATYEPCREDLAQASRQFQIRAAELETGRIVPVGPEHPDSDEYSWFWRSGYALGKPGVTKAVVWHG